MQKYIEIAIGVPSNRGKIIKEKELTKYILKCKELKQPLYKSYYSFDEEILEHFEIYKTISSFKGKFYLDKLIIDIDKGKSSDSVVWQSANEFIKLLEDDWQLDRESIGIWYSGTGYHISIPDIFQFEPSYFLPNEVKATIAKYFPQMPDLKPFMRTGLIRVGYTINSKSNRYKIPLTYEEFQRGYNEIIELSKNLDLKKKVKTSNEVTKYFHELIVKTVEEVKEVKPETDPTRIITCVQKIYNEGAIEGKRHENLLALVSVRRRNGSSFQEVMDIAKAWNKNSLPSDELEKQVKYFWEKGYTLGCDHATLKKYCDPKCIYFEKKNLSVNVDKTTDLEIKYIEEIRNPNRMKINLGKIFFSDIEYYFNGGEVVYIIGDTKIGKTALIQNIVVSLKEYEILYLNLEVAETLFYRRLIQIDNNMSKEEVEEYYKQYNNSLSRGIAHIKTMNESPTLDQLKRIISENNYKILVIDVLEKLKVKGLIGNDKLDKISEVLREIANKNKILVIGIHHISKSAAVDKEGRAKELNIHSGKFASSLEQSADKILGFSGLRDNPYRYLQSLGARDEKSVNIQLIYNTQTFKMRSV